MYIGRSCWLCGRNGTAEPLDKHHIFGGAYRKKSEKYGLTVYLCHGSCHIFGEKAVHSCRETMDELHRYGQKMAMERMGWTKEDFVREFGRNYLDEEDLQPTEEKPTGTFQILDEGIVRELVKEENTWRDMRSSSGRTRKWRCCTATPATA